MRRMSQLHYNNYNYSINRISNFFAAVAFRVNTAIGPIKRKHGYSLVISMCWHHHGSLDYSIHGITHK